MTDIITREEAAEQGLVRYFTGVECINGHLSERYTKGGGCTQCMAERTTKWKEEHPERWLELGKKTQKNWNAKVRARSKTVRLDRADYEEMTRKLAVIGE